jgi:glutathione peroxidase
MQYIELNAIQSLFKNYNFHILGFPTDIFAHQEPGETYEEILHSLYYVRPGNGFVPNFQMFDKIDVNGKNEIPLYRYLKSMCPPPIENFEPMAELVYTPYKKNDIRWNFEKFLIDKNGKAVMRISPGTKPSKLLPFINCLLNNGSINDLRVLASQVDYQSKMLQLS